MPTIHHWGMVIGGTDIAANQRPRLERHHPASGQLVASFAQGSEVDVNAAVAAAASAGDDPSWRDLTPAHRSDLIFEAARLLLAEKEDLAAIEAAETGKPLHQAVGEIEAGAQLWKYAAAVLRAQHGQFYPHLADNRAGLVWHDPVGVVALILPWNFPFIVAAERLPFILAAGCTVVAKPSEYASGSCLATAAILKRAGFPDGVYNVVTGLGPQVGAPLVDHPGVAMISFTGSTDTGRAVMAAASRTLKRVSLELGGKSPVVVFADADLDAAAAAVIHGFTHNGGQCCIATSRLLVQDTIAADFQARLRRDLASFIPVQAAANQPQWHKVVAFMDKGRSEGRTIVEGGPTNDGLTLRPAVFADLATDASVWRDEVFGPVLAMASFTDEADAIAQANDTIFGLAACVWSGDEARAMRVARRLKAGRLWINAPQDNFPELPVGGFGASGIGREAGLSGIATYCEVKSAVIRKQEKA
ncbi:aldehyde dehydrogenase family protein [Magnetospirillum sulfuroxidans]|uniref:Aldehyde dehydrogenase family protein n=1 Tax=Magnetospirillum sulfuroxidans TaxID=611300 RepID=A0ABS5IAL0_9PROT|nr:aldehyde dehydrogenase family protein [Magnetospirillum sulfuroxidans]MBR9971344.1 aldehyde dehydrogenase family protein [Magnetospirillum sulfuroxidans]